MFPHKDRQKLVSEWKFDGNAKDSVGNNHGALKGNPTWAADRYNDPGKAIALDGVDDYVDCGRDKSLSFGNGTKDGPFSITWWQKSNTIPEAGLKPGGKQVNILNKGSEYWIHWGNAFRIRLISGDGKGSIGRGMGINVSKDQWTHIVVTYDGSGNSDGIKFYQNGKFVPSRKGNSGSYTAMNHKKDSLTIGKHVITFNGFLDDFRIYNHALNSEEVETLYGVVKPVSAEKINDLKNSVNKLKKNIASLPYLNLAGRACKQTVNTELVKLERKMKSMKDRDFLISSSEIEEIDLSVERLNVILTALEEGKIKRKDYLSYVVSPISDVKILPTSIPGEISDEIRIIACRGEYEPGSFVIFALSDISSLEIKPTDLKGEKSIIPSKNIDIKIVKCWYQAGTAWHSVNQAKSTKVLVPELLLNNDSLVKVDYEKKENYLKLSFPEGEKYIWISDPSLISRKDSRPSVKKFPVKDSPVLLPVAIPAMRNQQFWVTVRVPEDAKPGIYTGRINLSASGKLLGALTLKLKVLPFKLSAPYYTFSIDYHGYFDPKNPEKGTISSWQRSRECFKKDLENMVAHGLSNCTHYAIKKEMLGEVLNIRKEAGMDNKTLYLKHGTIYVSNPTAPEALERIKKKVRDIIEFVKPYGTETVYFFGMDEVVGERLKSQRLAWKAVREAGGRIFSGGGSDNIKMMGDIQDLHIKAFWPQKGESAKWHAYGHKIFSYANPQCGVENPVIYRRNFGLLLWKYNYDGVADNAYQHTYDFVWNDFDHPSFRSHTITYPTVDGPIDTIAWEGYREACDDVRYVTTLQKTIVEAKKSGSKKLKNCALLAEEYLKKLKEGNKIEKADLNVIRMEIITHILNLRKEMK